MMKGRWTFRRDFRPGLLGCLMAALLVGLIAVAPVRAEDRMTGQLRDLVLQVPETWHFVDIPGQGLIGYLPDARHSATPGPGVIVQPKPIAEVLPKTAIVSSTRMRVAGREAEVFSFVVPDEISTQGWWVDFDRPASDGAHLALSLSAPVQDWARWGPVFQDILTTAETAPLPRGMAVPDLAGDWFTSDPGVPPLRVTPQDEGAWFVVLGAGDGRQALVRLGPSVVALVDGPTQATGTVDPTGQRIDWADGPVWSRVATAPDTRPAVSDWQPVGPVLTAALQSIAAVRNGPKQPSVFSLSEPMYLDSIVTYHWNDGLGAPAGRIGLRDAQGAAFGPWQAQGSAGQGGVPSAYWTVEPRIVLPAGDYVIVDSEPATWSTNAEVGERGIFEARVRRVEPVVASGGAKASTPSDDTAAQEDAAARDIGPQVLFEGRMSEAWRPVSVAGGDFDRFAVVADGLLRVDVPAGNAWGKTGIWSATPPLRLSADQTEVLRFQFDPSGTDSFVLALGNRDDPEEWSAHVLRFSWSRSADGTTGTASLLVRQAQVSQTSTSPVAADSLELRINPDGTAAVVLPDGQRLEARLPEDVLDEGLYLYAMAMAPDAHLPARMALRAITLDRQPAPEPALLPYPDLRDESTLFDGTLGAIWVPHAAGGGVFGTAARLRPEGLVVEVPEGSGWGNVGILSPGAVVWLDAFDQGGSLDLVFTLDPARTDGFALALAQPGYGGVGGNGPGAPNVLYSWVRAPDGASGLAEVHVYPHPDGDFHRAEVGPRAPSQVRMTLRAGEVTVSAEGMPAVVLPFPAATSGAGFRLYAYSVVPEANAPTRMLLKSIRLVRTPGSGPALPGAAAAPGVKPLPVVSLFDGQPGPAWLPIGIAGGDFSAFATFDGQALSVSVPEGHSWGKTGLLSAEPLLRTDERLLRTPTRIEVRLDPARPQNMVVALSDSADPEMWLTHRAWYTFTRLPDRGVWVMGIHVSPYLEWSREISADWMAGHWDGRLWIDIGPDWTALEVPGGPRLRAIAPFSAYQAVYASVIAHAPREGAAAAMKLRGLSLGLLTPTGMTAVERWTLLDPSAFDGEGFLFDLATTSPALGPPEMKE